MRREARQTDLSAVDPIERRLDAIGQSLAHLREREAALVVRAPVAGVWIAPDLEHGLGLFINRGAMMGHIVQDRFRFTAAVPQKEASHLFSKNMGEGEVRIIGQAGHVIPVGSARVIPAQQELLPSAALGWFSGGEIATSSGDQTGRRAAEPFFELRAPLDAPDAVNLHHGCSGRIRFALEPEPLLRQWVRKLRQLVQKRYQV